MNQPTLKQTPTELTPAYERPIESIDERMKAQIDWENGTRRSTPRDVEFGESNKSSVDLGRIGKKAGALVAAGAVAFGAIKVTERAIDHELDTGRPTPEQAGSIYNTGVDKDGNTIRIYPGSVNK
jgi:hypothetical protein